MTDWRDSLSCARKCWWSEIWLFYFLSHKKSRITSRINFSELLDALNHVTCVIFSRILLDHRFPTSLKCVAHPCRWYLHQIRENAAAVLKFQIGCRILTCHCLELFVNNSSFWPWTGPNASPSYITKILIVFVADTDLAAAAAAATYLYLEAATA